MAENLVSYVDVWRLAVLRSAGDWRRLRRQVLNPAVQNAPTQRSLPVSGMPIRPVESLQTREQHSR